MIKLVSYSIQEGFERDTSDDWDRFLYNGIVDYGFTHEAFIPGLTSYRVSQGQTKKQYVGSVVLPTATAFAVTAWATGQAHVSLSSAAFTPTKKAPDEPNPEFPGISDMVCISIPFFIS